MKQQLIIAGLLLCSLSACEQKGKEQATEPGLLAWFKPITASDTLQFEVSSADAEERNDFRYQPVHQK